MIIGGIICLYIIGGFCRLCIELNMRGTIGVNPKMVHNPLNLEPMSGACGVLHCHHLSTFKLFLLPALMFPKWLCCFQHQTSLPTFFLSKLGNGVQGIRKPKTGWISQQQFKLKMQCKKYNQNKQKIGLKKTRSSISWTKLKKCVTKNGK